MSRPVLYGFDTSTYTQIVRLILTEKGIPYDYVRTADWSGFQKQFDYRELNPFGMVPVLDHEGLRIYETLAIATYIDATFSGPPLQPADPVRLARMHQIMSIHDNYVRRPWVSIISGQRNFAQLLGLATDESAIADAQPDASRAAEVLNELLVDRPGKHVDLADLYLVPAAGFFSATPEGANTFERYADLRRWWQAIRVRPSASALFEAVDSEAPDPSLHLLPFQPDNLRRR